ncbi:hypothetical protein [Allopontixanthobacter sediminis]|uniref:Uncharacterized protein n=1 Tax=Allopontixanthobacter sediminis TaxID=1689985 RepID=A0A845B5Q0_9SPHN|nr:hypothetical protein [Allopontixanthobacter sediminis]MXP42969.1 hypothetical protein [Allopontixanthobacter sediminis]
MNDETRKWDTGLIRPYRPCPPDFAERYIEIGQGKEIEEHYRTNWRIICRWIEEAGGDALRAKRHKVSGGFARPNKRAKRYVLGKTLTAVRARKRKE